MNLLIFWVVSIFCVTAKISDKLGVPQVVSFSNKLVPKLLQSLLPGRENIVVAPFGLATNLAMVMEAVEKNLEDERAGPMLTSNNNVLKQALRHGFKALLEDFEQTKHDEEVVGSFNRAIIRSSSPLPPSYKEILEIFYMANITQGTHLSNSSDFVLELQSDAGIMSHWKDYQKMAVYTYLRHQSSAPFTTSKGDTVEVPMVPQFGTFRIGYLPRLKSQAVELLLEAPHVSLLLIMPDLREAIDEVLVKISNEKLSFLAKSLPAQECEVVLPQLVVVTNDIDLSPFLRLIGLSDLFASFNATDKHKQRKGMVAFIKQRAYFATSFISVNSVGSSGVSLGKRLKMNL
ncbi:hypothetical protein AAG570_009001 [Ranatra chinensis]|uniref:Serpin domain-containing protein n=1 Tax=Ranatra chinensis TaxID=642074 RepID=A0ABD0YSH7_9HEMI